MALADYPQIEQDQLNIDPRYFDHLNSTPPEQALQITHRLLTNPQILADRSHFSVRHTLDFFVTVTGLADLVTYVYSGDPNLEDLVAETEPLSEKLRRFRVENLGSSRQIGQRAPVLDHFGVQDPDVVRQSAATIFKSRVSEFTANKIGHLIAGGRIEVADMLYEKGLGEEPATAGLELAHRLSRAYSSGNPLLGIHPKHGLINVGEYIPPLYLDHYMED